MPVGVTVQQEGLGEVRPVNSVVVLTLVKPCKPETQALVTGNSAFSTDKACNKCSGPVQPSHKELCTLNSTMLHLLSL